MRYCFYNNIDKYFEHGLADRPKNKKSFEA